MTNKIDFAHLSLHDRHEAFNRLGHTNNEKRAYESHLELCAMIPKITHHGDAADLIRWAHRISTQLFLRMGYRFLPVEAIAGWKETAIQTGRFTAGEALNPMRPDVTADEHFRRPRLPRANPLGDRFSEDDLRAWKNAYTTMIYAYPVDYQGSSQSYFTERAWIVNDERIFTFNTDERLTKDAKAIQVKLREFLALHKDYLTS